jgi:toxin ParE1/3/4
VSRKVFFRAEAEADLFALYRYIADAGGLLRADDYIGRIEKACMSLATFSERGTRRDDIAPGLRTIGFERRVAIAFKVLDETVEIVSIAYAGRDFEGELREE